LGETPPFPPPPQKNASAAKPILACLYKTLTMGARRSCGQFVPGPSGDQLIPLQLSSLQKAGTHQGWYTSSQKLAKKPSTNPLFWSM
jgi:hypothetical protein